MTTLQGTVTKLSVPPVSSALREEPHILMKLCRVTPSVRRVRVMYEQVRCQILVVAFEGGMPREGGERAVLVRQTDLGLCRPKW